MKSSTPTPQTGDHWVYRCFNAAGRLLYIGVTSRGFARFNDGHSKTAPWWTEVARIDVEHVASRGAALELERVLILDERPLYNTVHSGTFPYRIPDGPAPKRYLPTGEMVEWLDADPDWFAVKMAQGLPHMLLDGDPRFSPTEVAAWLRRHARTS